MTTDQRLPVKRTLAAVVGAAAAALLFQYVPQFEGERLTTYRDPVDILTYCDGETAGAVEGKTYTPAECHDILESSLIAKAVPVDKCIHVPLTYYQRAAFISMAYNVGDKNFCGSRTARLANSRQYAAACRAMNTHANGTPAWVFAGNHILPGLVSRRATERKICEGTIK